MASKRNRKLERVLEKARERGSVTFDEIQDAAPEDFEDAGKLDKLISRITEMGVDLIEERPETEEKSSTDDAVPEDPGASAAKLDDPVKAYFSEMSEIPMLTREEEVELSTRVHASRASFRRRILSSRLGTVEDRRVLLKRILKEHRNG